MSPHATKNLNLLSVTCFPARNALRSNVGRLFVVLCSLFFALCSFSAVARADTAGDIAAGVLKDDFIEGTGVSTDLTIPVAVGASINIVFALVGTIFLILIFYAGIIWITAQGDSEKIIKARQTIIRATLGFLVTMIAYSASVFITTSLSQGSRTSTTTPNGADEGPIGCCLDKVSATGRPGDVGPLSTGIWTNRMATFAQCEAAGEDPDDPNDVRFGGGDGGPTWAWDRTQDAGICKGLRQDKEN